MRLLCLCPEQGGMGLRGAPGLDGPKGAKVLWGDGSNPHLWVKCPFLPFAQGLVVVRSWVRPGQAGDLWHLLWDPPYLGSKANKARKGFSGDRAVPPSSPGRSRTTRHARTRWCCRIRGTGTRALVELGAAKGFPRASPLPIQTKAKGFIAP